tara:strand:- start:206 stop:673 length:468 start_codon:yes stop_codon:yes gene_type:complete
MKMIFKNISKFILIILLLNSCGYSPMFKDFTDLNFSININETLGARKINNMIISNLKSYTKLKAAKKYNISIDTEYKKNVIAKDSTGAATEYKIIVSSNFKINSANYNEDISFTESFNMQSMSNKLDEKDYEENIQNNLTNTITRKLILKLSQLE